MTIASANNGTQPAVINTEHTLHIDTNAKTFVLEVDTSNLANGEVVELRVYKKVLSTGAHVLFQLATIAQAQANGIPGKVSIPTASLYSIQFTLKQTAGVGRNFPWNVITLD